jgi:hypothetical protein
LVASDIGVGLGILTALRSTAFRATQGECSIPLELTNKHSISADTLRSIWGTSSNRTNDGEATSREALRGAVVEMANAARFHLHRARENQSGVPREGRTALLPAVCGLHYLNVLEGCDYDVTHTSLVGGGEEDEGNAGSAGFKRRRRLGLMLLLGRTWMTGTF